MMPAVFMRVENVVIAAGVVLAFVLSGFAWWWLIVLFLVFDLSMLGYLASPRVGAITYNLAHNYVGPVVMIAIGLLVPAGGVVFVGLAWAFHVAADRSLGYGLKYPDSFEHTTLGMIGNSRRSQTAEK